LFNNKFVEHYLERF